MPFTTGLVTNTRDVGQAATNVVVNVHNMDQISTATVVVHVFVVPETTLVLTPAYQSGFVVQPDSASIHTFNVAGNVAYVVQLSVISALPNVNFSVYGLDEFGNLVQNQGITQAEMTFIASLTPIP